MNPGRPFEVRYSGVVADQLRELLRRAADAGVSVRLAVALQTIERQLIANPLRWGDPYSDLRAAELTLYRRVYEE